MTDSDADPDALGLKRRYGWSDYISAETEADFNSKSEEIGKLINYMINNPGKFGV